MARSTISGTQSDQADISNNFVTVTPANLLGSDPKNPRNEGERLARGGQYLPEDLCRKHPP